MVLVTPNRSDQHWSRLLDEITVAPVEIPSGTKLYVSDWEKDPLPPPPWNTFVSLVDSTLCKVAPQDLDPKLVKQVARMSKNWSFEDLEREMKKYPRPCLEDTMDVEIQVGKGLGEEISKWLEAVSLDPQMTHQCPQPPPADAPPLAKVERPTVDLPILESAVPSQAVHTFGELHFDDSRLQCSHFDDPCCLHLDDSCSLLAELTRQIDTEFQLISGIIESTNVVLLLGESFSNCDTISAKASGKFPINEKEQKEIAKLVYDKIFELETQKLASEKESKLFAPEETENLHGELEKDLEKYKAQPKLYNLLWKYKEVFGPLPPPENACPLVQMDVQLKEEWKDKPLRQKCWPLPVEDQKEIEQQAEELLKAGLIEAFPKGEIPLVCSPTFLVDKKESKTRRMVIHFRKLNARSKQHAAYLPDMEQLVESLAKCRYKTKLDMRSGFWQVGLSQRAKDLCTFCVPSGRCFRPLCMMFGLQGAPGVFQELMEVLSTKCKESDEVRRILKNGHLGSFFDDTGLGTQTLDEHFILLEHYFRICQENHIRIKLSKCQFMQENMEYLGFDVGWGQWKPSSKRVQAILNAQVKKNQRIAVILGCHELLPPTLQKFHIFFCTPN